MLSFITRQHISSLAFYLIFSGASFFLLDNRESEVESDIFLYFPFFSRFLSNFSCRILMNINEPKLKVYITGIKLFDPLSALVNV